MTPELLQPYNEMALPVVINHRTKGHAYFVAFIYRVPKPCGKGHDWWILEVDTQTVKRMDTY